MKRVIGPFAALLLTVALSGCAGDPVALAQAVRILNEGCQRTVDLNLDRSQPDGGALRMTRACAPQNPPQATPAPQPETPEAPKP